MLVRRNNNFPTLGRERATTRFSDWLDEFFDEAFNLSSGSFIPEFNVYETDKAFEVTVELPGMKKEDIEISMGNNALTISGEREANWEDDGRKYHLVESRFGTFSRSLPLPNNINEEKITANYENGVLSVHIPKLKEKSGKKIKVK